MTNEVKTNSSIFFKFFDKFDYKFQEHIDDQERLEYVLHKLDISHIITLNQTHSTKIVDVDTAHLASDQILKYDGDGLVTSTNNIAIAIKTADCVPVLFFCPKSKIIAAAHCGWRGSHNNIIKILVNTMKKKSASDIYAILGPAIQKKSYIVKKDLFNIITKQNPIYSKFFELKNGILRFDLPNFVKNKLSEADVKISRTIEEDSFAMPEKYPSYRYSLQRQEKYSGYILSIIFKK